MCVQDRELQPTPIYKANTHTQGLSYVNISLKFPPLCIRHPKVFLSPFSSSHVGNFQDCSGCFFFLLSLSFTGRHKVKRGKDPYQELNASMCHPVTSHDNHPDLKRNQNTQTHTRTHVQHSLYPIYLLLHTVYLLFFVCTTSAWDMYV